ncbi:TRPT1 [Symbiodinium sp. CCMP2592]|nr:TRPT1 [Symbiodinium sp. CCMP2592]
MLRPEHEVDCDNTPYWDPLLRIGTKNYKTLVRRLDKVGLLSYTTSPKDRAGMFFVRKSDGVRQRLIIDGRRANTRLATPPSVRLCSPESFAKAEVTFNYGDSLYFPGLEALELNIGLSDIRDCFHRQPRWLQEYFCLDPIPASSVGLAGYVLDGRTLSGDDLVYPMPSSLPMGCCWSLYFAQMISDKLIGEVRALEASSLLRDRFPPLVIGAPGPGDRDEKSDWDVNLCGKWEFADDILVLEGHEEDDDTFEKMFDLISEGLHTWVEIMTDIPSQMYDLMSWKTTEPEMDRLLQHFYPGGRQSAPDADETEETYEDDPRYPLTSTAKEEPAEDLAALGVYETGFEPDQAAPQEPGSAQSTLESEPPAFQPFSFQVVPTRLHWKTDEKLSKRLSRVLRHDKGDFGVSFYPNMTTALSGLIKLPIFTEVRATQEQLLSVVDFNEKQRFRLLWGHSLPIDNDQVHAWVDPEKVPDMVHATHYDFYKKIFDQGLLPGGGSSSWRQQIHPLADNPANAKFFPAKADIILHIDKASAQACTYFLSDNGYFLTENAVPSKYIRAVTIRETGERVEAENASPPTPSRVLTAYLQPQLQGGLKSAYSGSQHSHRRAYMAHGEGGSLQDLHPPSVSCTVALPPVKTPPTSSTSSHNSQGRYLTSRIQVCFGSAKSRAGIFIRVTCYITCLKPAPTHDICTYAYLGWIMFSDSEPDSDLIMDETHSWLEETDSEEPAPDAMLAVGDRDARPHQLTQSRTSWHWSTGRPSQTDAQQAGAPSHP